MQEVKLIVSCENDLGEGPCWNHASSELLWIDYDKGTIWQYDFGSGQATSTRVAKTAMVVIPTDQDHLMVAVGNDLAIYDRQQQQFLRQVTVQEGKPANRLNDGKCDSRGRLWIGTMDRSFNPHSGALYKVEAGLRYQKMDEPFTIPNGIAWNRQDTEMYMVDSAMKKVFCYDFDPERGNIENKRVLIDTAAIEGLPDGMTIDGDDNLWIAFWQGGCVVCFDSKTGKELRRFATPVAVLTSCCFGGPELDTLFITSSRKYDSPENVTADSAAGGLFAVQPGVAGLPADYYKEV